MAPMIHLEELLSAYLDGELSREEVGYVARHLDGCEECIAEFRALQEARAAVRTLPRLELPVALLPDHETTGELLSAYLDGELSAAATKTVVEHLGGCPACRDDLHDLDAARTAIRSMPTLELPAELVPAREHDLDEVRHVRRRAAVWATSIAAMVALVVGISTAQPPAQPIDFTSIANRHAARDSVDTGFIGIPALAPVEGTE